MTYFADLTPYTYGRAEAQDYILNVGWLDDQHQFPTGEVPDRALKNLLVQPTVNLFRGSHMCEICKRNGLKWEDAAHARGNGEVRITYKGIVYVAPVLIVHYILEHEYLPPQEFINACLNTREMKEFQFAKDCGDTNFTCLYNAEGNKIATIFNEGEFMRYLRILIEHSLKERDM